MKVRLKLGLPFAPTTAHAKFQFHEGPIKTINITSFATARIKFQFHEGPIKTFSVYSSISKGSEFQFHEGPIKTLCTTLSLVMFFAVSIP